MSIQALVDVWKHSPQKGEALLLLLALADNAGGGDDPYSEAFSPIRDLAARSRMSEGEVRLCLRDLVAAGEIIADGVHESGEMTYRIVAGSGGRDEHRGLQVAIGGGTGELATG